MLTLKLTRQKCQYTKKPIRSGHCCVATINWSFSLLRDHASGNEKMVRMMPGLKVYGGDDRVDAITKKVSHSHNFKVRLSISLLCNPNASPKCLMSAHWCLSFPAWNTQCQMPVYTMSYNWSHLLLCDKRKQQWATSCFHRYGMSNHIQVRWIAQILEIPGDTGDYEDSDKTVTSVNLDQYWCSLCNESALCHVWPSHDLRTPFLSYAGDTLFVAGCGKFFEGTAEQMHRALIEILGRLPPETVIICTPCVMSVKSISESKQNTEDINHTLSILQRLMEMIAKFWSFWDVIHFWFWVLKMSYSDKVYLSCMTHWLTMVCLCLSVFTAVMSTPSVIWNLHFMWNQTTKSFRRS